MKVWKNFKHSLDETAKMQPESLTVHTLSFKRASEMTRNKDKYKVADRETVEQMMKLGEQWNAANGYEPYYLYRQKNILGNLENVGYAKPSEESIYNIVIMEEVQTIIGVGCGASSKFIDPKTGKITQFYNPKDPAAYILTFEDAIEKKLEHLNAIFPETVINKGFMEKTSNIIMNGNSFFIKGCLFMYTTVELKKEGRLARLTLNRPASMNAMDGVMMKELADVFED